MSSGAMYLRYMPYISVLFSMYRAILGLAMMKSSLYSGCLISSSMSAELPEKSLLPRADSLSALICLTFSITSKSLGLPGMPKDLRDGDTARQIVFSVRSASATTRLAPRGSSPLSTHSQEA